MVEKARWVARCQHCNIKMGAFRSMFKCPFTRNGQHVWVDRLERT